MANYAKLSINAKDQEEVELPDNWEALSPREQRKIIDEHKADLRSHVEVDVEIIEK